MPSLLRNNAAMRLLVLDLQIYLFSPDEVSERGRKASVYFAVLIFLILILLCSIKYYYFVWIIKTGKKSAPLSEINLK